MAPPLSRPISPISRFGPASFPSPFKPPYDVSPGYHIYTGNDFYTACRNFQDVQAVAKMDFDLLQTSRKNTLPHQTYQFAKPIIGAEGYPLLGSAALLAGSQPLEIRPAISDNPDVNKKMEDCIERGFSLLLKRQDRNGHDLSLWGMERVRARAMLRHSTRVLADAKWTARARRTWGAIGDERARLASTPAVVAVECGERLEGSGEALKGLVGLKPRVTIHGEDSNGDGDGRDVTDTDDEEDTEDDKDDEEDEDDSEEYDDDDEDKFEGDTEMEEADNYENNDADDEDDYGEEMAVAWQRASNYWDSESEEEGEDSPVIY